MLVTMPELGLDISGIGLPLMKGSTWVMAEEILSFRLPAVLNHFCSSPCPVEKAVITSIIRRDRKKY